MRLVRLNKVTLRVSDALLHSADRPKSGGPFCQLPAASFQRFGAGRLPVLFISWAAAHHFGPFFFFYLSSALRQVLLYQYISILDPAYNDFFAAFCYDLF